MSSIAKAKTKHAAIRAWSENRRIYIELNDTRIVSFPAERFSRLKTASQEQLDTVTLRLGGTALRWEQIDEDLTVEGVVSGSFEL